MRIQESVGDGRDQIARRIARLQKSRNEPTRLGPHRFHRQRCAYAPLSTHRHAEQGADDEKSEQVGGEGGGETQYRIECYVEHQDRTSPEAIRQPSEDESTNRTQCQRERHCERNIGYRRAELSGNVLDHEDEQEEVERIQSPTEIGSGNDVLLRAAPAL